MCPILSVLPLQAERVSFSSRPEPRPWLQVDLKTPKLISGVVTQGSPDMPRWVAAYTVAYSLDGVNFTPYTSVVVFLLLVTVRLPVRPSVRPPARPFVCLSVCLSVFLSGWCKLYSPDVIVLILMIVKATLSSLAVRACLPACLFVCLDGVNFTPYISIFLFLLAVTLCFCRSVSVTLSVCLCLSLCLCLCQSLSLFLSLCLSFCLSVSLSPDCVHFKSKSHGYVHVQFQGRC